MKIRAFLIFSIGFLVLLAVNVVRQTDTVAAEPKATPGANTVAKATVPSSSANSQSKPAAQSYGLSQVNLINDEIRKGWTDADISPSSYATDGEWVRRVYLDIYGRIPTLDETVSYLNDKSTDKKLKRVNLLLSENDRSVEQYARNWADIWIVTLIGRPMQGNDEARRMLNRDGMAQFLRRSFQKNKPYDTFVTELLTATGNSTPDEPDYNGAVNFLSDKLAENGVQATAKTAQVFLGLQVQCTQCHNHPFNDWKQNQFWELNAFFRQTRATAERGRGRRVESVRLMNQDFRGEGTTPDKAELYYEKRNGEVGVAYPVFVDGTTEIGKSGRVKEVNRRAELAQLIVNSDYMPKALVNRMWSHFFGYGFTKPADDIGPHNQPTHPDLLDQLALEFRKNSFNVKDLIRWIVLSEPYALSSSVKGSSNKGDDPSLGDKPKFSHFYVRQMRAEELYRSLIESTQADTAMGSADEQQRARNDWLRQFTIAFGTDEGDDATTFNGTIPQVLMMFNGELIRRATNIQGDSFLAKLANNKSLDNKARLEQLFLSALSRYPKSHEMQGANAVLAAHRGNTVGALQDIWWVLLNSNEFILNH